MLNVLNIGATDGEKIESGITQNKKGSKCMKRQIRRSVFETNSSSMHSLTVMKKDEYYTSEEILDRFYLWDDKEADEKDCVWNIWEYSLEFGRSPLATFKDKWCYACASLVNEYNDNAYKELERLAFKHIPNLKKIELPTETKHIYNKDSEENKDDKYVQTYGKTEEEMEEYLEQKEKEWGIELGYWEDSSGNFRFEKPYTGYIDEDVLSGFLKKENITLEEFLINKKYVAIQDGDEYCEWDNLKRSGLIDVDKIDHEYPDYE